MTVTATTTFLRRSDRDAIGKLPHRAAQRQIATQAWLHGYRREHLPGTGLALGLIENNHTHLSVWMNSYFRFVKISVLSLHLYNTLSGTVEEFRPAAGN